MSLPRLLWTFLTTSTALQLLALTLIANSEPFVVVPQNALRVVESPPDSRVFQDRKVDVQVNVGALTTVTDNLHFASMLFNILCVIVLAVLQKRANRSVRKSCETQAVDANGPNDETKSA